MLKRVQGNCKGPFISTDIERVRHVPWQTPTDIVYLHLSVPGQTPTDTVYLHLSVPCQTSTDTVVSVGAALTSSLWTVFTMFIAMVLLSHSIHKSKYLTFKISNKTVARFRQVKGTKNVCTVPMLCSHCPAGSHRHVQTWTVQTKYSFREYWPRTVRVCPCLRGRVTVDINTLIDIA